jgi:hypothetical protein
MSAGPAILAISAFLGMALSCNFDAAFNRYCEDNPRCMADSGTGPDVAQNFDVNRDDASTDDASTDDASTDDASTGDASTGDAMQSIPAPKNCGGRSNHCASNEVCNPYGQVCMQTCTTLADCPTWFDSCSELHDNKGALYPQKVCNCTSSDSCSGYAGAFLCNKLDGLCERSCAISQECSGFDPIRTCEIMRGLCQPATPSCTSGAGCVSAAQPRCDLAMGRCVGCVMPSDCAGRPDGQTECSSGGACVSPQTTM